MLGAAEKLPFDDASFDAVVSTLCLCSVDDVEATILEVARVLKKNGRYGFVEHVAAEDGTLLDVQQRVLDPLQQRLANNCHLHRPIDRALLNATKKSGGPFTEVIEFEEQSTTTAGRSRSKSQACAGADLASSSMVCVVV